MAHSPDNQTWPTGNIGASASHGGIVNVAGDAIGTANHRPRRSAHRRTGDPRRADVGVLTVLTEELDAVVNRLRRHAGYRSTQLPSGSQAHSADVSGEAGVLHVVAMQTLDRGPRSAAMAYHRLQDTFKPALILLVGIAGGIRGDLDIGDVVISDEVIYYDARRETEDGPRRRGQTQPMTPFLRHRLNEFFRRYGSSVPTESGDAVRIVRGPIGSGDAVVTDANSDIIDFLRRFNEKTVAVETEAGGVGQAFYEHIDTERSLRGWLTIRGISDLANREKGYDRHQFAADRAALVMDCLLPILGQVPAP
jgi:adenosylhomocysteine nucleosidase